MSLQYVSLRQLRVFEAAAQLGSFSKAAAALHLTQPGVSMHIKELERCAGLALFERIGKKLFVTEAGREMLVRAREIMRALKDAEEALDGLKGLRRGLVNLGVVSTAKYFVPQLLARFRSDHPDLELRLSVHNRGAVIQELTDNAIDLAIMGRAPQSGELTAEPFAANPHVIVAAPSHPLARARRLRAAVLEKENFIVREPGSGTRVAMQTFFDEHQIPVKVGMEMSSNETIKQAVMAGIGISFLSQHTIGLELETGKISVLDVRGTPVMRRWHVAHLTRKRLSPTAEAFKRFVLSRGSEILKALAPRG